MVSRIQSAGIVGVDGYTLLVECDLSGGLPAFDIVGLPDAAVKESRDRVRAAIRNSGFDFPLRRITVNLAPADLKKEGTVYDLPIFIGILSASGQIMQVPEGVCLIGELSLEGSVRPVSGVLSMALTLQSSGITSFFVPAENAAEAAAAGDVTVYPVYHAADVVRHLSGESPILPFVFNPPDTPEEPLADFSDVMGQENVKRALEIAAAGGHNILLSGPPGSGKSMLAKRILSILPEMTREEAIGTTKVYSVAGMLPRGASLLTRRPFRAPHHTVSASALAGGGSGRFPRPGEISLAHNGVLFLDEFPEFHKDVLEVLRQPLEDGAVTISRVSGTQTYPARIMLVCAMNPCKCGWFGHPSGRCTCSAAAAAGYTARISGPLLDRIDLFVDVSPVPYDDLANRTPAEPSSAVRARVETARRKQLDRYAGTGILQNSEISAAMIRETCPLDGGATALLESAFHALGLTARSYDRILKVSRTIADLAGAQTIESVHLAEALQYRPEKKNFS